MAKSTSNALYKIEELQKELAVPTALHVGACSMMEWKYGKAVTKEEYAAAVKKFREHEVGRRNNA